jgi:hypothetical protein
MTTRVECGSGRDKSALRAGTAPQAMVIIRNTVMEASAGASI